MKAAIHNPYLDTLGGGERYTLTFAKVLAEAGYEVDIEWKDKSISKGLEDRFGEKLNENINFVDNINRGDGYDLCFWVSDGSIPTLRARRNFLHFQVPFHRLGSNTLLNKMKFFKIDGTICNSNFTKSFIDHEYGVESTVIYPPVDTDRFKPKRKEDIILFVGRFSELLQSKGQEILVQEFKKFFDHGNRTWKLILAGGSEVGARGIVERIKKSSVDYPIEVVVSPTFNELKDLYGKAKIYWAATGFGIDESHEPEKVEHFGISVVEAMSSCCVPIVFSAGGHKEIVTDGLNGFLWEKLSELQKRTEEVVGDKSLLRSLSLGAVLSSKKYSYERFKLDVTKIL